MSSLIVYLAGKVRGAKWEIQKALERGPLKHDVAFISSDGDAHSEHLFGFAHYDFLSCRLGGSLSDAVMDQVVSQLLRADLLCAFLDVPNSYGSIAEIAYMSGLGKRSLVCVVPDAEEQQAFKPGSMFDAYYFVSCLPGVEVVPVANVEVAQGVFLDYLLEASESKRTAARLAVLADSEARMRGGLKCKPQ